MPVINEYIRAVNAGANRIYPAVASHKEALQTRYGHTLVYLIRKSDFKTTGMNNTS